MRITDRNLGYEAEYKNGNYIIKRNTIIEKFTDIEPIPKTAKVYKKGKEEKPKNGVCQVFCVSFKKIFWGGEPPHLYHPTLLNDTLLKCFGNISNRVSCQ